MTTLYDIQTVMGYSDFKNTIQYQENHYLYTHLFKLIKWYMHQAPSAENFQHQAAEITADCLDQSQHTLNGVLCAAALLQMCKYGDKRATNALQFGSRQEVFQGKILHEQVVVSDHRQSWNQTCHAASLKSKCFGHTRTQAHTHTHKRLTALFPGLSGWASTRKVKPIWIRDGEWQWHQLGHMQVCTSLQTDNHASTTPLSFLQAGCPSCRPTNSVKALKATDNCVLFTLDWCINSEQAKWHS